ncbi:MAG: TatD family nuclease-associated radical SAM protein [Bacillota bacterium]
MSGHKDVYAYDYYGEGTYINLTNRCTNRCTFCIRSTKEGVGGHELWLKHEPDANEVLEQLWALPPSDEVVFCGYGEPTMRLDVLLEVARAAKQKGKRVRINTNGHANLIHKRNIVPELAGLVDTVSISLNAPDAKSYNEICRPDDEQAFQAVLDFARACAGVIPKVVFTVMDIIGEEAIEKCRALAKETGAELRVRTCIGNPAQNG